METQECPKCHGTGKYIYTHTWTDGQPVDKTYYCVVCPLGPIAERQDFPNQYPPCSADQPTPPDVPCEYEDCPLHTVVWLEQEGCNHEQAVGITAVFKFADHMGYGPVADALGGMDEFNTIIGDLLDWSLLPAWYDQHQPLICYIMEVDQKEGLLDYWWQAKHPQHPIPERGRISIWVVKGPDGQWQPYHTPGFPIVVPEDYDNWVAHYDATKAAMSSEEWATAVLAHFTYTRPLRPIAQHV